MHACDALYASLPAHAALMLLLQYCCDSTDSLGGLTQGTGSQALTLI
jgi:hypothetical protein